MQEAVPRTANQPDQVPHEVAGVDEFPCYFEITQVGAADVTILMWCAHEVPALRVRHVRAVDDCIS